jgi:hypothetical protein
MFKIGRLFQVISFCHSALTCMAITLAARHPPVRFFTKTFTTNLEDGPAQRVGVIGEV